MKPNQSREEKLYHLVVDYNVEGIRSLAMDGVSLEWKDTEGRTPLIIASMDDESYAVAETLIELGANIHAYCPESGGGTPLHYAAMCGLKDIVMLLLSHGANACVKNNDGHTPLAIARQDGNHEIACLIESHIRYFSGHNLVEERCHDGSLDTSFPPSSSKEIWTVVVPCSSPEPPRLPEMELVIYDSVLEPVSDRIILLSTSTIKEPEFHRTVPVLEIVDNLTNTCYRFYSVDGDKQQLWALYNACKGISQVMPSPVRAMEAPNSSSQTTALSSVPPSAGGNGTKPLLNNASYVYFTISS